MGRGVYGPMHFEQRIPIFKALGVEDQQVTPLKQFIDHLWEANGFLNLVSRKMTLEELIDNHVIDCLLALQYLPKNLATIADFGTGGGLPGVLFALMRPESRFRLYEKSKLKQDYLDHCKPFAPNLDVLGEIPNVLPKIDLVTSRAFKPIDVILDMSRDYYSKGGKYFLLKARREKIDEELILANKKFKDMDIQILPLKNPILDVERHLVLIEKRRK